MIASFGDNATEDIFNGRNTKAAVKILPAELQSIARRKLDWLNRARNLSVLKMPPNNHLEALRGHLRGFWSIRINRQYRIIFQWAESSAHSVKIVDYH